MPNQSTTATIPELLWRLTLNLVKIPRGGGGSWNLSTLFWVTNFYREKTCDVFSLGHKLWLMWLIVNDSTEVFTYWMFIQASWCVILLVIKSWNGSNYISWTKSLPHSFVFAGHENSLVKVHHFDASLCYNSGQFLPELDFLSLDHFTTNVLYRSVSFWCVKGKQRKKTFVKTCTFVR